MMNGNEKNNYEDYELQKPDYVRQRIIDDIINHLVKNKQAITKEVFRKNGVPEFMINYTFKNRYDDLKMMNEQTIKELKEELAHYKKKLAGFKGNIRHKIVTTTQVREDNDNYYFRILKNHKVKETHKIPKKNVQYLEDTFDYLKKLKQKNVFIYREIVSHLILVYDLDADLESFNGGKNRKIYFKTYYYPLKILENKGYLKQKSGKVEVF